MTERKRTNNELQNTTQKTKDRVTLTPLPVQVGQSSNIVSYGHTIGTVGMVGKNLNVILMELFFSRRDG
jgi:hypothetical protein